MKLEIDSCLSVTGWVGTGGVSVSLNEHKDYCVGGLASSLVFHFPAGSMGETITKVITPVILGEYDQIVLSSWSRRLGGDLYLAETDFDYEIGFGGTTKYLLPTPGHFSDSTFGVNGVAQVSEIKIMARSDSEDWIVISGIYALKDEYPLDVYVGVKEGLELARGELIPNGIFAGETTCAYGSDFISMSVPSFLERNSVLVILDGVDTETHQVENFDGSEIRFTSLYDGRTIKHPHTQAPVYMNIPIEFGVKEKEAIIPGIAIWGMAGRVGTERSDIERITDSFIAGAGAADRRTGNLQIYTIYIDCEARHDFILAMLSRIVKWFIAGSVVWVNARKHDLLNPIIPSVHIAQENPMVIVDKIQYTVEIEVYEERAKRIRQTFAEIADISYTPKLQ